MCLPSYFFRKIHENMKIMLDKFTQWVYNENVNEESTSAGKEFKMGNDEMTKADLIAMLVSIREVAKTNGETATVEHINKILEEVRK